MSQMNEVKTRPIIVVGDKFHAFVSGKINVLTKTQVRSLLMLSWLIDGQRIVFIAGQGLGDGDRETIKSLVERSPHRSSFDLSLFTAQPDRAARQLSHKHRPQNTLISTPRRIDDSTYALDFLLDEGSELMGDHQTGQHIQGIVLVEAGRQAFLAVTEAFYLPQDGTKYYFVINDIATSFKRFAFPVPTLVLYRILESDEPGQKRHRARVAMTFEQAGEEIARMDVSFTVYEESWIARKEADLARVACEASLAGVPAAQASTPGALQAVEEVGA